MIEDALWEGLARGGSPQGGGESEGLNDWQVGLQVENGGARPLLLLGNMATLLIEDGVDATQDLHQCTTVTTDLHVEMQLLWMAMNET